MEQRSAEGWLESGVFRASPGSTSVDQALARRVGEACIDGERRAVESALADGQSLD